MSDKVMLVGFCTFLVSLGISHVSLRLVDYYWKLRREKEAPRMSQHGIVLPAPKLGLPSHLESEEALLGWLGNIISRDVTKDALLAYCRHWRIERSRADDLERMVEQLEAENRQLREPRIATRILSLFKRK